MGVVITEHHRLTTHVTMCGKGQAQGFSCFLLSGGHSHRYELLPGDEHEFIFEGKTEEQVTEIVAAWRKGC